MILSLLTSYNVHSQEKESTCRQRGDGSNTRSDQQMNAGGRILTTYFTLVFYCRPSLQRDLCRPSVIEKLNVACKISQSLHPLVTFIMDCHQTFDIIYQPIHIVIPFEQSNMSLKQYW